MMTVIMLTPKPDQWWKIQTRALSYRVDDYNSRHSVADPCPVPQSVRESLVTATKNQVASEQSSLGIPPNVGLTFLPRDDSDRDSWPIICAVMSDKHAALFKMFHSEDYEMEQVGSQTPD